MIYKQETFIHKATNETAISAGAVAVFQDVVNAEANNNLPHNALTLSNQSDTCELFIFLDDASDLTKPDYILYPNVNMGIKYEEGINYHTIFVKNTHAVDDVAIGELKVRISTNKQVK